MRLLKFTHINDHVIPGFLAWIILLQVFCITDIRLHFWNLQLTKKTNKITYIELCCSEITDILISSVLVPSGFVKIFQKFNMITLYDIKVEEFWDSVSKRRLKVSKIGWIAGKLLWWNRGLCCGSNLQAGVDWNSGSSLSTCIFWVICNFGVGLGKLEVSIVTREVQMTWSGGRWRRKQKERIQKSCVILTEHLLI